MTNFYTNVDVIGGKIAVRAVNEDGKRDFKLTPNLELYLSCHPDQADIKTLYGGGAKTYNFDSVSDAKDFIKRYSGVSGTEVFGQQNFALQSINKLYPENIKFDASKISAWSLDIETKLPVDERGKPTGFPDPETAEAEITIITLQKISNGATFVFASKDYPGPDLPACNQYINAGSEEGLLKHFIDFWNHVQLDVVTGWNIDHFDIPYIINRCNKVLGEDITSKLSPWGKVYTKKKKLSGSFGKEELVVSIAGVSILDYLAIYKKFTFGSHASYSLNAIAKDELGLEKLDHSEFSDFNDFYDNGYKKYVDYNIRDTELVKLLDDKLQLLKLIYTIAFMAKINFNDVFSPVKTWDSILHNRLLADGKVVPLRESNPDPDKHIEGAYVKDPKVGFYEWLVSVDATSLYPSIMMTLNISPETYIGIDYNVSLQKILDGECDFSFPSDNSCSAVTGVAFDKSFRGIIPTIVQEYMALRKTTKREMLDREQDLENAKGSSVNTAAIENDIASLDALQMAFKILLNSLYGAMGNSGFRFFNSNVAETITLTGQYVLRSIETHVDSRLNEMFDTGDHKYVIYIDTDSVYFDVAPLVKKWMSGRSDDRIAAMLAKVAQDQIQKAVNGIVDECCQKMRVFDNKISFKLEVIGDKGIWVAKKKYVIRAHSSEGVIYKKPRFKTVGLEMVRSSTPKFVREKLTELLPIIFDSDESALHDYLEAAQVEFFKLPVEEIAIPRGLNEMGKYKGTDGQLCVKNTPLHTRGALAYNQLLVATGLDTKYELIADDAKIKYVYLREPNKAKQNVISFPVDGELPKEFGLIPFIDTHTMWEKTMTASTKILLDSIGWSTERRMVMF